MPYPPPAGPPELGIFQGIGLVPELPTLVGAYFLTNVAGLTVWAPVAGGVLPDPTGHAGAFLTTDGVIAFWSSLPPLATGTVFDIRLYGAVPLPPGDSPLLAYDSTAAVYATIAAWLQSLPAEGQAAGGVYVPAGGGDFYISRPLVLPPDTQVFGDSKYLSNFHVGTGDSSTPTLVQGFAGPLVHLSGTPLATNGQYAFPEYTTSLLTGSGQAMKMRPGAGFGTLAYAGSFDIDDCFAWSKWLNRSVVYTNPSAISLRCQFKFTTSNTSATQIVGTKGPEIDGVTAFQDVGIGLWVYYNTGTGGHRFEAFLTTTGNGQQVITGLADITPGQSYNLELDYNGSFFDFYVDGVNQGHLAASGTVYKTGWEDATVGVAGPEWTNSWIATTGVIDSIELARVAYHTGTGSFTPPTSKYTWGADTMWLCNFDQTVPTGQVFVVAQTRPNLASTGYILHYCRVKSDQSFINAVRYCTLRDIGLYCESSTSGIMFWGADHNDLNNVFVDSPVGYGIACYDANSFFCKVIESDVTSCNGTSVLFLGYTEKLKTVGSIVGIQLLGGWGYYNTDQPAGSDSFISMIYGPSGSPYNSLWVQGCSTDEEGAFTLQRYSTLIQAANMFSATFQDNAHDSLFTSHKACTYTGVPFNGSTHIGDAFFSNPNGGSSVALTRTNEFEGKVTLINCSFPNRDPFSNDTSNVIEGQGWVVQVNEGTPATNLTGFSITDVQAFNLAGDAFVLHGYTTGVVEFQVPEIDNRYTITLTPKTHFGTAPAAGAWLVKSYTPSATGFTFDVEVDPGTDCILYFTWHLLRTYGGPLSYTYVPAIPSSVANPLLAVTGDFAVGVSLIPTAGNNTFTWNFTHAAETILEGGTTPGTDWWELYIHAGGQFVGTINGQSSTLYGRCFVSENGKLCSLLHPGTHNVVLSVIQNGDLNVYVDGGKATFLGQNTETWTQPATKYTGARWDTSQALTLATLRNEKEDRQAFLTITTEPDAGPQAGMLIGAFFGDDYCLGVGCSTDAGSYASQLAGTKYGAGTYFYYLAVEDAFRAELEDNEPFGPGLGVVDGFLTRFWAPWGSLQTDIDTAVVNLGTNDLLLAGDSAADVWTSMQKMLEGVAASLVWVPGTQNYAALNEFVCPTSGTATCVIGIYSVNVSFNTSAAQTCIDLAATINGTAGLQDLVVAVAFRQPPDPIPPVFADPTITNPILLSGNASGGLQTVLILVNPASFTGADGNGIACSSDGVGGARWGNPVTFLGISSLITIAGQTLNASFVVDADTTVDAIIAAMAANGTINALVTGTRVASQLVVTANAVGSAGNAIFVAGQNSDGIGGWQTLLTRDKHLENGYDGLLSTGVSTIIVANVPPFGDAPGYSAGKNTQRGLLNTSIANWVTAHAGDGALLADFDAALVDGGDPTKIDPLYLDSGQWINDAGQTVLVGVVGPLLP